MITIKSQREIKLMRTAGRVSRSFSAAGRSSAARYNYG